MERGLKSKKEEELIKYQSGNHPGEANKMDSEKSSEFRERGSIFRQMGEMKKKIQLVEGERKAIFEDCEAEKAENKERIKKLKEEVRDLQNEVQASNKSSEGLFKHIQDKKSSDLKVLKRKSGDEAVETLDFKVADLRKKLNKLRYQTKQKRDKIASLMKEYEKVVTINAEIEKAEEILEDSAEGQRLRFLENEIHKTNLKLMEGETIKKKYLTILDMLKKERLTFGNQLEGIESQLKKQDEEIVKLKATHVSAIATRDLARQNQHRKELALLAESKERERKLIDCRKTAEERKNYFESMERHMFARGSSVKETGRESISTSEQQASSVEDDRRSAKADSDAGDDDGATTEGPAESDSQYEEAFSKMKKAAGVSDIDEVVRRFETQEETANHLQELQARAEKEIRDLGVVKEKLEAEWELVKFMGQEENTELREKMEDLEETITQEQERKQEAEEKLQSQNKLLIGIREGLDNLVEKLFLGDPQGPPSSRNSIELLSICTDRLSKLMVRLSGINIFMKRIEMDEEGFVPVGLEMPKAELAVDEDKEKEGKKDDVESGPEEEEVPTRGFLKRQANMIVDAKSRSKRGNRRR